MVYVYILESAKNGAYYIGQSKNIENRLKYHNSGYSNYTMKGIPWLMKWYCQKQNRSEAVMLERKLKNLSKVRLKNFISKYS